MTARWCLHTLNAQWWWFHCQTATYNEWEKPPPTRTKLSLFHVHTFSLVLDGPRCIAGPRNGKKSNQLHRNAFRMQFACRAPPVLCLRSCRNAEDANSAAKLTGTSVIEFPCQVPLEESKPCAIFLYSSSQRTCTSFNWTGNEYYLCFSFCVAPFFFHLQMVTFCIMLWYIRAWPLSKKPQ